MADCRWADLADWIVGLCVADSPHLPAALWLISTSSSPEEQFQSQAEDWQLEEEMATLFAQLRRLCAAIKSIARDRPAVRESRWRRLGDTVKGLLHHHPANFRFALLVYCIIEKEFGEWAETSEPGPAELGALLDEVDQLRPDLLPGILKMMALHPAAGALAARWRPPERSQKELLERKLALFVWEVEDLIREDGGRQGRLWEAVGELFIDTPTLVAKLDPANAREPTLETLIAVEAIIDDAGMAVPGKVFRICQLLTSQSVCH